jgi:hypothetical protein
MEAGDTDLRKAIQTNITNTKKQKQKQKKLTKESQTRIKGRRKNATPKVNASVRKNFGEEQRAAEKRCEEKRDR